MRFSISRTSRIPDSLGAVTTIRRDTEVDPRSVGVDRRAVERIWAATERLYGSGVHPALQLCLRRRGRVLLDRALGHASGNGPDDDESAKKIACTPDTPFVALSASKPIAAMVIHLLDQRNLLRVDDPVCEYIPEFGKHKKQWITIRHVLAHRAGIPLLPPQSADVRLLADEAAILRLLCDARTTTRPGRWLAYHAITGGFILGEVVRRVTGKSIREVVDRELRRKLGLRWFGYGVKPRDVSKVSTNYLTGPPPLPPLSTILERVIGLPVPQTVELSNDPRFLTAVVPSANLVTTASGLARFYQLLLNGGELDGVRVFEPRTILRATAEQAYLEVDLSLGAPIRYSMGFMLGGKWLSFYGPDTQRAFGHVGFTNIVGWADPERQVAATLMTSGKPLVYPQIYHAWDMLSQIGQGCPKETGKHRSALAEA